MSNETKIRSRIIRRIYNVSQEKLEELDNFISKLETESKHKTDFLSFAGCWADIDNSLFDDFTKNLISNRRRNRIRIYEYSISR